PTVIVARLDQVELVAAFRPVLEFPQPAVGREHQAVGRAMSGGPGFRRGEVRPGKRVGAYHWRGLGELCVAWRIDHGNTRRADLAGLWIAGRRFAVERQTQNLAQRLVGILDGCHALTVADRQEEILAIGRECDRGAELSAATALAVAPDDLELLETGGAVGD